LKSNPAVKKAIFIGTLCSVSYLAVYIARNVLGVVSPQMIENGFTNEYIGRLSSAFFIFYAFGQLINGAIGDKIKARYMLSLGLLFAGVTNILFSRTAVSYPEAAVFIYALTGFSLSMIYGPMTKVVAENNDPIYATRTSLGYTFASFIGSPLAGIIAAFLLWKSVFMVSSVILFIMAIAVFVFFLYFEKIGYIKYNQYKTQKSAGGGIKVLIQHHIIKFSLISILTGVIRTTVVFWLPTYIAQYLGFSSQQSAGIYTAATFVISLSAFAAIFVYEKLHRDMNRTILIMFSLSTVFFALVYLVKFPVLNIIFIVLAVFTSNCSASMLWSRYCPSLRDTGMVSGVTGFLDFLSYMSASISSIIFANSVETIGWGNLILVWTALMAIGIIVSLPYSNFAQHSKAHKPN